MSSVSSQLISKRKWIVCPFKFAFSHLFLASHVPNVSYGCNMYIVDSYHNFISPYCLIIKDIFASIHFFSPITQLKGQVLMTYKMALEEKEASDLDHHKCVKERWNKKKEANERKTKIWNDTNRNVSNSK